MTPIAEAARAAFPALELDDEQAAGVRVGPQRLDIALDGGDGADAPPWVFAEPPTAEFPVAVSSTGQEAREDEPRGEARGSVRC